MKSAFVTPAILFAAYARHRSLPRIQRLARPRITRGRRGVIPEVTLARPAASRRTEG